ncbi:MAG: hypothetical protein ABH857_00080, partial [Elusimicrobiota bacterium]
MKRSYIIIILVLIGSLVYSKVPNKIIYQGMLHEYGKAITGVTRDITVSIFDVQTGGGSIWTNTYNSVEVSSGIFTCTLEPTGVDWSANKDYWIELRVGSTVLSPRQPVNSKVYALHSKTAENVSVSAGTDIGFKIGGSTVAVLGQATGLKVEGDIESTGTVKAVAFMGDGSALTGVTGLGKWTDGTGGAIYYNSGNVGIGTATPLKKLSVNGNILLENDQGIYAKNTAAAIGNLIQRDSSDQTIVGQNFDNNMYIRTGIAPMIFETSNAEQMRIAADGNVGIGTINPTEVLEVSGTVKAIAFVGDGTGLTGIGSSSQWSDGSGGKIYYNTGNVGIGVADPNSALRVEGDIAGARLQDTSDFTYYIDPADPSISAILKGNVGIGTTNPTEVLEVSGTVKATAFVGDGTGLTGISGSSQWSDGAASAIYYNTGNVGIGINPPQEKLHVVGGVRVSTITFNGAVLRQGNTTYGTNAFTHVNLGVNSITGENGQNWQYCSLGGGYQNTVYYDYSTISGGVGNNAYGYSAVISGGDTNSVSANMGTVSGGYKNTASDIYAAVGGGAYNKASSSSAVVSGGSANTAAGKGSVIAGGSGNSASQSFSTILGGETNTSSNLYATIGGGVNNTVSSQGGFIGSGSGNSVSGEYSAIAGGWSNEIAGDYASIPGGNNNKANGDFSFAAGRYMQLST